MFRVCKHAFRKEFWDGDVLSRHQTARCQGHYTQLKWIFILYRLYKSIQIKMLQNICQVFSVHLCAAMVLGLASWVWIRLEPCPSKKVEITPWQASLKRCPDDSTALQVKHLRLLEREIKVSINPSISCGGHPWPAQELVARHLRELDPSVSVIELGCGCGALACYLALEGYDVIATDLPEMSSFDHSDGRVEWCKDALQTFGLGRWSSYEGPSGRLRTWACQAKKSMW